MHSCRTTITWNKRLLGHLITLNVGAMNRLEELLLLTPPPPNVLLIPFFQIGTCTGGSSTNREKDRKVGSGL